MKILIFKPSDSWIYCGGCRVCIAKDIKDAEDLFNDGKFYSDELKEYEYNWDIWVLVEEFPTNEDKRRIILNDYNWA